MRESERQSVGVSGECESECVSERVRGDWHHPRYTKVSLCIFSVYRGHFSYRLLFNKIERSSGIDVRYIFIHIYIYIYIYRIYTCPLHREVCKCLSDINAYICYINAKTHHRLNIHTCI